MGGLLLGLALTMTSLAPASQAQSAYQLLVSVAPDRSGGSALHGSTVEDSIYVFLAPESGVMQVRFWLDNPSMSGKPRTTERRAPWDFDGTVTSDGTAKPFDTNGVGDGLHTISAQVDLSGGGTDVLHATFTVQNADAQLSFSPTSVDLAVDPGGTASASTAVSSSEATSAAFQVTSSAPWLSATPASGNVPATLTVSVDATGLANGVYGGTVTASADGHTPATFDVTLTVGEVGPADQIHLSWVDDPSTTMTVVWRTLAPDASSVVEYRSQGASAWQQASGGTRTSGTNGTLREATITGLEPATTYEYRVNGGSEGWSPVHTTRTAPAPGPADFSAIYFADTGLIGRGDGLATGTEQAIEEMAALDPTLFLPGGDYIYYDTDKRYGSLEDSIDAWFTQNEPFATGAPMMPTYGNHEVLLGESYTAWSARFATPQGFDGGRFYSFDVGDVHFVSILAVAETQGLSSQALDWIRQDIEAAKAAGQRWIVPYMHVPSFSDGKNHPSNLNLRGQLGPLFEQLGVQVVLTSHDQSYERTYPLTDVPATNTPTSSSLSCYTMDDGVTYVKVSPAGKLSNKNGDFSQFATNPPPHSTAFRDNTLHHFTRLAVSDEGALRVETYGFTGDGGSPTVIDAFEYRDGTCPGELKTSPGVLNFTAVEGEVAGATVALTVSDGTAASFEAGTDAPWLTAVPASGSTPASLSVQADASGLAPGTHQATLTATAPGYEPVDVPVTFKVTAVGGYRLLVSGSADRSSPAHLEGRTLQGDAYVFTGPDEGVARVVFWLDDPSMSTKAFKTENNPPFDLAGTAGSGAALPWDTTKMADGSHTITARLELSGGAVEVVHGTFVVSNLEPQLRFQPGALSLSGEQGESPSAIVDLSVTDGSAATYALSTNRPWLTALPASGSTPRSITVTADTTGLALGTHTGEVTAGAPGLDSLTLPVSVSVGLMGSSYRLLVSPSPDRSGFADLEGQTLQGNAYVFTGPEQGVSKVSFWLDNPAMTGTPTKVEKGAPYDFAGTAQDGRAFPWNTSSVSDGSHTISALVELSGGGSEVVHATFTVANTAPQLRFQPTSLGLSGEQGDAPSATAALEVTDGTQTAFTLSTDRPWLSAQPTSGTTPQAITVTGDTAGLAAGTYNGTVTATTAGFGSVVLPVTLVVQAPGTGYRLLVSPTADRSTFADLEGQTLRGDAYVFTGPDQGVSKVSFWLDNPQMTGTPTKVENAAPYDFAGTTSSGTAFPWDTTAVPDGQHTITALLELSGGGSQVVTATFLVANDVPSLAFTTDRLVFDVEEVGGTADPQTSGLITTDGVPAGFVVQDDADWLSVSPISGTTPATLTLSLNTTGLPEGNHQAAVTATSPDHEPAVLLVTLAIGTGGCVPLACSEIKVSLPYRLDWGVDHGKILAGNGVGTGFTWADFGGNGYLPEKLSVDTSQGVYRIQTTSGGATGTENAQDNALGVGIAAPNQAFVMETEVVNPPAGTGKFEQAGLWFGNDQDNYVKLIVLSTPGGTVIEYLIEVNGARPVNPKRTGALNLGASTATLILRANPFTRKIEGSYRVDGGPEQVVATFSAPPEFFSFDAAGIDPRIGTRSFGGVFATHRTGSPLTYTFDSFSVVQDTSVANPTTPEGFSFDKKTFPVPNPTSMAWGPDGRLYVTELFGKIHAITLDTNKQVVSDEVITTLGSRLTLGLTVDPASTASNVVLWVSHSSPSVNNGEVNSSTVTRLSGSGFTTRQDVITGLPRAKANHAINSIHFGPDGRLYMAHGGNTGAGAPNLANTEFGDRSEQPLSAALLVADINAAGFEGQCATPLGQFGVPATCDVSVYASGLRNSYDFVHHSNGSIYAPDNGLGVTGTYPPKPTPDCTGLADASQHNPGEQPDIILRLEQGKYYGHPNPYRNECVFKDGSKQGVAPLPNYVPPIHTIGNNTSSNGTIEYTGDAFCGDLRGDLLIANYSVGDDLVRYKLAPDGNSIAEVTRLATGFTDPLPVTQGPDGTIYVGELGAGQVAALVPQDTGCWSDRAPLPAQLLDVGGTGLSGKFYVAAGKTSSGPRTNMYVYDPATDSWATGPNLPGPGVENPAMEALNGKLYVFGGSTDPFSGAVANAAVYDPGTNAWTTLTPMPTARGGANAKAINGLIYVVGGMDANGASVAKVEVYNPSTNSWSAGPSMGTRRDNPGAAVLDGRLYVFGGRTREANGTTVNGTLASVEMLDPATGTWVAKAPMPTGRRTMVVGTLNGRAQVMGGEASGIGDGTFPQNEEYDPVTDTWRPLRPMKSPRHGAAAATISGVIYVAGGGTASGSSFSNVHEAFAFQR
ncbi:MAG TPA: kelch repeat-containing protein [Actinomycetota bacterium]